MLPIYIYYELFSVFWIFQASLNPADVKSFHYQHVTGPKELFRSGAVKDGHRIHPARDLECNPAREGNLDIPRNDIRTWPSGSYHTVNASSPPLSCKIVDELSEFLSVLPEGDMPIHR